MPQLERGNCSQSNATGLFDALSDSSTSSAGIVVDGIARGGLTFLEPGCGVGDFHSYAGRDPRFTSVEMNSISGRLARVIYPQRAVSIEIFRDSKLRDGLFDASVETVPFADVKIEDKGTKYPLHN